MFAYFYISVTSAIGFDIMEADSPNHRFRVLNVPLFFFLVVLVVASKWLYLSGLAHFIWLLLNAYVNVTVYKKNKFSSFTQCFGMPI